MRKSEHNGAQLSCLTVVDGRDGESRENEHHVRRPHALSASDAGSVNEQVIQGLDAEAESTSAPGERPSILPKFDLNFI
jgi:hypothetical protein